MECIFCKIINREIPSDVVYEDGQTLAFLDIHPVSRGHTLVIPKKHVRDLLDADEDTLKSVMMRVKKVAHAVMKATGADGFNLSINTGEASGQVVFHLHFHIIPRFKTDNLKPWPHMDSEPKTRSEIAEAIKKSLTLV